MPQNKKQHYVPKFYLKRFTPNERLINLYNLKSRRKIIGASLSGQCYKDYMYGTDGQTENALSLIEGETSKLFKQIDEIISLPKPLTEQHLTMLLHILIQHGRTKYATEELDEITDKMTKETWGEYFKEQHGIDINKFKITIKDSARFSVQMSMRMYPLLMDLHYKLLVNQTAVDFIVSDNPVVHYSSSISDACSGAPGQPVRGCRYSYRLTQGRRWFCTTPPCIESEETGWLSR